MLTVIGDLVEDVIVRPGGPTRFGTDNPSVVSRSRGGSAANVAARAAPLTPTRFIGRVGEDGTGARLVDELVAVGVDVRVQRHGRTGTVVVLVDPSDGERTMFPDRGAAGELGPVDPTWLHGTTLVHVPAYGLADGSRSILGAVESARRAGAAVSVDASAVTTIEAYGRERFTALLRCLAPELLFANAEEAVSLGIVDRSPDGVGLTVVKDGPRPARLLLGDGRVLEEPALRAEAVVDTTGAGDAFAAGFLAARLAGADPVECCRAGHRSAVDVVRSAGA